MASKVKLDLLTDIDMLLMVEKGVKREICHAIHRFAKANNKYMKDHDKNKELPYFKYWDVNNLYGWTMSEKLAVNDFKRVEDISELYESFIKSYNEEKVMKDIFLKFMFDILKIYIIFTMIYPFCLKE